MRSKLAKSYSALFFSSALLFSASAFATVSFSTLPNHLGGNSAYYATGTSGATTVGTSFVDVSDGYALVDVSKNSATDFAGRPNMLNFQVSSDSTTLKPDAGQILVLTVWAAGGATSFGSFGIPTALQNPKPVPIANLNSVDCSVGGCAGKGDSAGWPAAGTTNFYYSVPFTLGSPVTIGFYPLDICTDYFGSFAGGSSDASGCSTLTHTVGPSTGAALGAGVTARQPILFLIMKADATTGVPVANGVVDQQNQQVGPLNLVFHKDAPTFACPDLSNIYFPGDGSILLNAAPFGVGSPAGVPGQSLIVAAKLGGTATLDSTYGSTNSFVSKVAFQGTQTIAGFQNSTLTPLVTNSYSVGFMGRDVSGLVAGSSPACLLSNVQTADIQGFLKTGKCFIATAAFRSLKAEPVELLREFRNQVLLKNTPGRIFVDWYYSWSPPAAEWLMIHPEFRYPVLTLLIPLEILAWMALHPVLPLMGLFFMGLVAFLSRKQEEAAVP